MVNPNRALMLRDSLEDALNENLRLTDEKTSLKNRLEATQAQLEEQVHLEFNERRQILRCPHSLTYLQHNHKTHGVANSKRPICNCGSLLRQMQNTGQHRPRADARKMSNGGNSARDKIASISNPNTILSLTQNLILTPILLVISTNKVMRKRSASVHT